MIGSDTRISDAQIGCAAAANLLVSSCNDVCTITSVACCAAPTLLTEHKLFMLHRCRRSAGTGSSSRQVHSGSSSCISSCISSFYVWRSPSSAATSAELHTAAAPQSSAAHGSCQCLISCPVSFSQQCQQSGPFGWGASHTGPPTERVPIQ